MNKKLNNHKKNEISTEKFSPIKEIHLPNIGLGTMRSAGTYIAALLQLEDEYSRPRILVDVAKKLGISLKLFSELYTDVACKKCGVSLYLHKPGKGCCL